MISIFSRLGKCRRHRGMGYSAILLILLSVAGWSSAQAADDIETEVMVSIRPLALITSALMEGVGEPGILVEDGASPHHYALKPSSMRNLMQAKLVVWVGPDLERFLEKPLSRTTAQALAVGAALPESAAEHHEHEDADDHEHEDAAEHEHEDADEHGDADEHEHDHGGMDVHPWLDPGKVQQMARQISAALQQLYPQEVERLQANLERFERSLALADSEIAERLAPLHERGFYVFHDAYDGFVEHYGLNQLGYFTLNPSRKPGARHLAEIRQQLEAEHAVCVLSEPQFSNALIDSITADLPLKHAELDPLAIGVSLGPDSYTAYLLDLAGRFESCLSP